MWWGLGLEGWIEVPQVPVAVTSPAPAPEREQGWGVRVAVRSSAGELLDVELSTSDSVRDLKLHIEAHWEVPCDCQNLALGTEVLEDGKAVSSYSEAVSTINVDGSLDGSAGETCAGKELLLTVAASADDLCGGGSAYERGARLRELGQAAPRFGVFTARLAEICLEHDHVLIQEEGVRALARVAKRGSGTAATQARDALRRWPARLEGDLREFLVKALAKEVSASDEWAVTMLIVHVGDADAGVRWTAVDALVALLSGEARNREEVKVVAAGATPLLEHSDAGVRAAAAEALAAAAGRGDSHGIEVVTRLLSHEKACVRVSALKAPRTRLRAAAVGASLAPPVCFGPAFALPSGGRMLPPPDLKAASHHSARSGAARHVHARVYGRTRAPAGVPRGAHAAGAAGQRGRGERAPAPRRPRRRRARGRRGGAGAGAEPEEPPALSVELEIPVSVNKTLLLASPCLAIFEQKLLSSP